MAKNEKRVQVTLACEVCKRRNYITTKNKQNGMAAWLMPNDTKPLSIKKM